MSSGYIGDNRRRMSPSWIVLIGVVALAVCALAAWYGRATQALEIGDPGALVRWGLPLTRVVHDIAAALTVGSLLIGGLLVPEAASTRRRERAGTIAAYSALTWGLAGVLGAILGYADVAGSPVGSAGFWSSAWTSTWDLDQLRAPAITALLALLVGLVAVVDRSRNTQVWLLAISVLAVLPLALAGHAAGSSDHDAAVNSLAGHLVGITLWVGGLLSLLVMWPRLGKGAATTVQRYSTVALWCYVLVALSGVLNAWIRIGGFGGLTTRYGVLVLLKVAAVVVLGVFGYLQRNKVVDLLRADPSAQPPKALFARLAGVEVLVMGVAVGLGVALTRSIPPVSEVTRSTDPALERTGYPTPPDFEPSAFWTMWRTEWLFTSVAVVAVGVYVAWVLRLRRRGDQWPVRRLVLWVLGWAIFVYAVDSAVGIYGRVMFSVHMVEHMLIAMVVPLFLVLAAPVTLALRALPVRKDATLGPRELLLAIVHSRFLNVLGNPVVAAVLFFVSLVVFYYSPLFGKALETHTGHVLMVVHFMLTGYLFAWVLVGVDPGPRKWPAPLRLLVLLITVAAHAFFGVALMTGTGLLAPDFFTALQLPWVADPLEDQRAAGGVAWGTGELPTLILAMLVTADWLRQDSAEGRRQARQADRDDDAELKAYNEYLASRSGSGRTPEHKE
ncbi:cytochrome c oxidase assembly protein [Luteipulveratus sp. YIM 133132]|uniref:cytochrome c oxidase assembly protein n=1 Tax=Luteipulveratus flavus TaxID=3031728 RepID=UPI0023AFFAB8|nr:cytochrome c oxidase assembly protein [Luteipulveratus sp. YIM 133132]MDE9364617.1 cytochrome c oxidase assembly protein [Luteipulveratus sp. YIM 133132]